MLIKSMKRINSAGAESSPPLSLFVGEKRPTYNKQRVQGKSYLLEQHLDGDISNAYLAVNLRSIKAAKTAD